MTGEVLGIDVGGSSVKAGLVDVRRGSVQGELISAPTPRPCTPGSLIPVLVALAGRLPGAHGRAGVAFPSVVKGGTAYTAANIDHSWIGTNGEALAAQALGRPALMLNDADAAGIAEMRFGSGARSDGPVLNHNVLAVLGTAQNTGGKLFPNTELGHLELRGMDAEKWASAQTRTVAGLDFPGWIARVNEYLDALQRLLWPDVFILGGAVSERFNEFAPLLRSAAEIRPARFANHAGVVGAALAAAAPDPGP